MRLQQRNRGPAFGSLMDMSRELDRLVGGGVNWGMPAEIIETDDEICIDLEVPGFREEDLEVTLEKNVLTISGEKHMRRDEKVSDDSYRLAERRYGRFQRSFAVPATVRADNCQASYENGVLTLRLPKSEEARPRRIPIGGNGGSAPSGRSLDEGSTGSHEAASG